MQRAQNNVVFNHKTVIGLRNMQNKGQIFKSDIESFLPQQHNISFDLSTISECT